MLSRMPVRAKCCSWRVPHMTQRGRGVQTATSAGWECRTWNSRAQGNLAGSATQSSSHLSFSSQEWLCSQPGQTCWLNGVFWKRCWMIKRSCESRTCTCRCWGLIQMLLCSSCTKTSKPLWTNQWCPGNPAGTALPTNDLRAEFALHKTWAAGATS